VRGRGTNSFLPPPPLSPPRSFCPSLLPFFFFPWKGKKRGERRGRKGKGRGRREGNLSSLSLYLYVPPSPFLSFPSFSRSLHPTICSTRFAFAAIMKVEPRPL
jgi:hypothetical protein